MAFVNNMPDTAFDETYRQFVRLVNIPGYAVNLNCFYIESVPRCRDLRSHSAGYLPVQYLYVGSPPDALVVTGTEPKKANLDEEPYWNDLAGLLDWAAMRVPAIVLSCLASHAALLGLYGIRRQRLLRKQSGVYSQLVCRGEELTDGLERHVAFPHSRLNDIPLERLEESGICPVIASPQDGWTVARASTEAGMMVFLQGHPEYARTTLLKEYRRDVRRYFDGALPEHPAIPTGYLDFDGVLSLTSFREQCEEGLAKPEDFPLDAVAGHITADWSRASHRLFLNWVNCAIGFDGIRPEAKVGGGIFA